MGEVTSGASLSEERQAFLLRLRVELVQALNGHSIRVADAWDILAQWDRAFHRGQDLGSLDA